MRWIAKAALQRGLSALPRGDVVNYWFQRNVTRRLPRPDWYFLFTAELTAWHFDALRTFRPELPVADAELYEFGAGWDLTTALLFWGLGVERQVIVDIRPNLRFSEINHTQEQCRRLGDRLEEMAGQPLRRLPDEPIHSLEDLGALGIEYRAPCDARATGLEEGRLDLISSSVTLEHIPADDIPAILEECRRILKLDGLISSVIDPGDHYASFDPAVSRYNFLKFSDATWRLVNSSLHYQNRLRAPDYLRMFEEAGLEVLRKEETTAGEEDKAQLAEMNVAPRFAKYSFDELAVTGLRVVARRPSAAE